MATFSFRFDVGISCIKTLPADIEAVSVSWVKGDIRKATAIAPVINGIANWDGTQGQLSVETTLKQSDEGYEDKFLRFSVKQIIKEKQSGIGHFMIKVSKFASLAAPEPPKRFPLTLNNAGNFSEKCTVTLAVACVNLGVFVEEGSTASSDLPRISSAAEIAQSQPSPQENPLPSSSPPPPSRQQIQQMQRALEQQLEMKSRDFEMLTSRLTLTEQQLAAAHSKIRMLEEENKELKRKSDEWERKMKERKSDGDEDETRKNGAFDVENSQIVKELKDKIAELELENHRYQATAEVLEEPHSSQDEEVVSLQRQLIGAKVSLAQMQGQYGEVVNALRKTAGRLEDTSSDLDALRTERKRLQERLVQSEEELRHVKRCQNRTVREMEQLRQAQLHAERDLIISGAKSLKRPEMAADADDEPGGASISISADLIAYAKYLGLDPSADQDLMWIAEEGLVAPLPEKWSEHVDQDGNIFYWNDETHSSQWQHPCDDIYQAFVADAKKEKERNRAQGRASYLSKTK